MGLARHSTIEGMGDHHLGPVNVDKEQRAVCRGVFVVVVEAAVWLKLDLSPSRVEEIVDELSPLSINPVR